MQGVSQKRTRADTGVDIRYIPLIRLRQTRANSGIQRISTQGSKFRPKCATSLM